MSPARSVTVTASGGVTEIVLDRPEKRNAINGALQRELATALREFDADPAARVAVLTGRDPAFCAGMDLDELSGSGIVFGREPSYDEVMRVVGKPVIGAVNGAAVTGGLELALHCDFLIASDRARFGDSHTRVGVAAGGGMTVLLVHAVGIRMARQMTLSGTLIDAPAALRCGLVNEVVPHAELLTRAHTVAAEIAARDPALVATHRAALWRTLNLGGDAALDAERAAAERQQVSGATIASGRSEILGTTRETST